jgi:hypothetical protein
MRRLFLIIYASLVPESLVETLLSRVARGGRAAGLRGEGGPNGPRLMRGALR